jgi:hypothetical protein
MECGMPTFLRIAQSGRQNAPPMRSVGVERERDWHATRGAMRRQGGVENQPRFGSCGEGEVEREVTLPPSSPLRTLRTTPPPHQHAVSQRGGAMTGEH